MPQRSAYSHVIGHCDVTGIAPITGGFGKYWVATCTSSAAASPNSKEISFNASSRPAEMPPPVNRFSVGSLLCETTKRSCWVSTVIASNFRRHGINAQCVVALWFFKRPARASSIAPSHTEHTHVARRAICRRYCRYDEYSSLIIASSAAGLPPGTHRISSAGVWAKLACAPKYTPLRDVTPPPSAETRTVSRGLSRLAQ